jgi:hypothetical protein
VEINDNYGYKHGNKRSLIKIENEILLKGIIFIILIIILVNYSPPKRWELPGQYS